VALLVRNLERSASGRAILAVRSAPAAAVTSGLSAPRTKIVLFVLASAVAGLGGVLFAIFKGSITATDLPAFSGFVWLAIVVLQGVRRIGGAVLGGLVAVAVPELLAVWDLSAHVGAILFGLGGVILAKHPDGVLTQMAGLRHRKRERPEPEVRAEPAVRERRLFTLEGVAAGYADTTVLRGVDLTVGPGEVVALLGANGAGKSTTCAVAAGDLPVSAGRVLLDGRDVTAWPAHRRARAGILLAPEGRGVFPGLTVEENLRTWLPDPEPVFARLPHLGERRHVPAGALSGGEQQLLTLAPALIRPPRVLVADEPSLGLAPMVVRQVFEVFAELRARGVALLLVEEKATEALAIADRVAFMRLGRVTWSGPRAEVDGERLTAAYLGVR
jgi:ABC-type branched-subunit amino acid transport system ATPase component